MPKSLRFLAIVVGLISIAAGCGGESAEPDAELSVGDVALKESFDIAYIGATAEPFAAILLRLSELELRQPGRIEELVPGSEIDPETVFSEFDLVIDSLGYFETQVDEDANRTQRPTVAEIAADLSGEVTVTGSGFNTAIDLYVFGLGGEGIEPIPWQEFILPENQELLNPVEEPEEAETDEEDLLSQLEEDPLEEDVQDSISYFTVGEVSPVLETALDTSGLNFEPNDLESTSELTAQLLELNQAATPFVAHLGFPNPITAAVNVRRLELPCGELCPPLQNPVLKLQSSSADPAVTDLFEAASLTQEQYANLVSFFTPEQDRQTSVDAWISDNTEIWSDWL